MIRKIVAVVVLAPLVVVLVMFAMANRQPVVLSFDPFDPQHPAFAVTVPLFVLIFALVVLGVVLGGAAAWLRQGRWRRTARRLDAETRRLGIELRDVRQHRSRSAAPPQLTGLPPA